MKKKFKKLVCVGIACFCIFFYNVTETFGNHKGGMLFTEMDIKLRADADESYLFFWPDSAIDYNNLGEPILKKYYNKENRTCLVSRLENGDWIYSASESTNGYPFANTKGNISYKFSEEGFIFYFPLMKEINYMWNASLKPAFCSVKPYYDNKGNLIMLQVIGNSDNTVFVEIKLEYKESNDILSITGSGFDFHYKYDENGRLYSCSYYRANYSDDGQLKSIYDNESNTYSILYYSSEIYIPSIELDNNTPIGNDNQGNFDLDVNIPIDSIKNVSITTTFPEGLALDNKNTSLALNFSNLFDLTITKRENNSWLIELNPKSLRNVSLRADEAKKMLQIAFNVDEKLQRGTYNISLNSILFETKGGNFIPEPAITVPATVERWGLGNERINILTPTIYMSNQVIHIQATNSEQISIYSITGHKLYEAEIGLGLNVINAASFPQGVLLVTGSSGWVNRLIFK